jgi:hypothetical protein
VPGGEGSTAANYFIFLKNNRLLYFFFSNKEYNVYRTFKGRGAFSQAIFIAFMLRRWRSLRGALASHSSTLIVGFG